jgi:threonine/homoserine/homoserine lactone efflux protein
MAESINILLSLGAIWIVAVVTPGPNFFITLRSALLHSRATALLVVLGIVTGTAAWGITGFLGISLLFAAAPWLYLFIKVLGGSYLLYLGFRLLFFSRGGPQEDRSPSAIPGRFSAFRLGLVTNLANPKTALFVASLFASAMPAEPSLSLGVSGTLVMVTLSFLWYAAVALLASSQSMTSLIHRGRQWVDRAAGTIFIGFGAHLLSQR